MSDKSFDEILVHLKTGKWNLLYFCTIGLAMFMTTSSVLGSSFFTPKIDHKCFVPQNVTASKVSQCNYMNSYYNDDGVKVEHTAKCSEWEYDREIFKNTMTSEYNLVCEKAYLRPIFQTLYMLGNFIGSPINGYLSDRFGRQLMISIGIIVLIISGFASTLPNIPFHLILAARFLMGLAHPTFTQSGYILCMENCEPRYRSIVGIVISFPWALGTIWWGTAGYIIHDWRWLQRVVLLPAILILILLWFFDESPRWLIVRGHHKRALKVMEKAAKWNNVELPPAEDLKVKMEEIYKSSNEMREERESQNASASNLKKIKFLVLRVFLLLRTPEIRRRTILMYIVFFVASTVYYGLSLNAVNFNVNPFLYMVISGIMEIPAYTVAAPVVARFGRKKPTILAYFICGGTIMTLTFIPTEPRWLVITLAMIGKLCISSSYQIIYLISSEIFPTEVRLQGLGTSNLVSRIGSTLAPFITDYLLISYPWAPSVVFGSISLLAALAAMALPETLKKDLPETVLGLEEKAKKKKRGESGSEEMEKLSTMPT